MSSVFHKVEFHYTYLIMAFSLVITGYFANLIIFTSLIIIHEFGHLIVSKIFNYDVEKVIIYPYGGMIKFNTKINTKIEKDLLIAISGVVFQSLYYFIILFLYRNGIIREYIYLLFKLYNRSMFIFNLLPIFPLDGSKILGLLLAKVLNFNLSNKLVIVFSFLCLIILVISNKYENNYSYLMIIGIVLQNIYKFYISLEDIYNRFLVERYLYNFDYKKGKIIKDKNKMYKNKYHFFVNNGVFLSEKEFLSNFFRKFK